MNEKTVGMLAKFTGVSVHTIKYYEKIGLLSSTRREHSNYRSYDIRACTDIYECMKYKNLGFALKEVGNLIKEADSEAIDNLLKKRLEEIDASLSELQELKKRVTDYLAETEWNSIVSTRRITENRRRLWYCLHLYGFPE